MEFLNRRNRTPVENSGFLTGLVGALLSGIATGGSSLAVSCCAGPALFLALGLGAGSATFFEKFAPYRLMFSIVSVAMLIFLFWSLYLRKQPACDSNCPTGPPKAAKIIFWIAVVLVVSALVVPRSLDALMLKR
ncbi:MAG TPA: mercuric transporter MerT family protein [Acidobacteriota bacterium]|nr:mercuric transporter MerT family protein [Acidobacteriota bacterium]